MRIQRRAASSAPRRELDLEEPLRRAAVELQLVDRLAGAVLAQLGGPVRGQQQQRHARLARLDRRGQQLGRGRARRAGDRHRQAARLGEAEREEARAALVDVRVAAQPRLAHEREHERGAARARRGARRAHPAARQLVDERPQQEVGVGRGGHTICAVPETLVLLHGFSGTRRAWDGVAARLDPERYRPLALDLPGHGEHAGASGAPITFAACAELVLAQAPERFTLCGYSLGGRVALHVALAAPERVRAARARRPPAPGSRTRPSARARREADELLAQRLEAEPFERFIAALARPAAVRG